MDDEFDFEKEVSDSKDDTKQVTLDGVDIDIEIVNKRVKRDNKEKYSHIGREL